MLSDNRARASVMMIAWALTAGLAGGLSGCGSGSSEGSGVTGPGSGSGGGSSNLCEVPSTQGPARISRGSPFPPQIGATLLQDKAPPAVSGGTLRVLHDGVTAVAADPDRDQVYVVDLPGRAVKFTVAMQPGDEPGRLAEDAAGRVHVALRGGGALVTLDPAAGAVSARRAVCAAPRGVAYDPATDLVHVACAGGELVSLPAAGGDPSRSLRLEHDLRDVVVDGDQLRVSRFRSVQVLTVGADGAVVDRKQVPPFRSASTRGGQRFSPAVAWKMEAIPGGGGVAMVHQRGVDDEIQPAVGGYGGPSPCDGIMQTAVTVITPSGQIVTGPAMMGLVVPVDLAISSDGQRLAIVAAGNAYNTELPGYPARLPRVFVTDLANASDPAVGCQPDGHHGPCVPFEGGGIPPVPFIPPDDTTSGGGGASGGDTGTSTGTGGAPGSTAPGLPTTCGTIDNGTIQDPSIPNVVGQPIAVAFDGAGSVIVQSREPALLQLAGGDRITLSTQSRLDTGHEIFHANSGRGIACASCHAEGNDDGRVWNFACQGPRRTQSVQVGLAGTEPFHWDGAENDFPRLVHDVFSGRMSGPDLPADQVSATLRWLDLQPRARVAAAADPAAAVRGQALFNDTSRGACVSCHSGEHLTNNTTVDVGTNGMFQVPSLVGVGLRGPYLHNGCAPTLADRFGPCGGDKHGKTSTLSAAEVSDLVAYLQTL